MDKDTVVVGCAGALVLWAVVAAILAMFLIYGANGLLAVSGSEYQLPYTLESFWYAWVFLMAVRGGSSGSK